MSEVEFKHGDVVKVVDEGETYSYYDSWPPLQPYKADYKRGDCPQEGTGEHYTVVLVDEHSDTWDSIALIRSTTGQVYTVGVGGLELVESAEETKGFKIGDEVEILSKQECTLQGIDYDVADRFQQTSCPYLTPAQVKALMKAASGLEYDESEMILKVVYEVVTGESDWEE